MHVVCWSVVGRFWCVGVLMTVLCVGGLLLVVRGASVGAFLKTYSDPIRGFYWCVRCLLCWTVTVDVGIRVC